MRLESYYPVTVRALATEVTTMPSADFCRPVTLGSLPSQSLVETSHRSPEVSLTAFSAQPPD